jgi:hypothetical protein
MNAGKLVGAAASIIGMCMVLLGAFNLHNLLFLAELTGWSNVPTYASVVMTPALYGLLILIDGMCIAGAPRRASMILYAAANLLWLLTVLRLSENLSVPIVHPGPYELPTIGFLAAFILFVAGSVVNSVTKDGKRETGGQSSQTIEEAQPLRVRLGQ